MNILVINCGSSSLKFQLIDMTTEAVQAKGLCERIGIDGSRIVYTPAGGEKMTIESPMPTHTEAIKLVLDCLTNAEYGVIKSLKEINAVGHRVVHGGEKFASSTIITDEVIKVGDHLFLFGFNDTVFVTDVNNGQKLILRHSLRLGVGIDAHQAHNSIRKMVDYEDSRGQNTGQPVDDCGIAQCYLLCVDGCCGLRCDLTEN